MDEVRVLWEVKRLVFGERCRTLDLTTQKKKCPELLTRVNTPWTDTHTLQVTFTVAAWGL